MSHGLVSTGNGRKATGDVAGMTTRLIASLLGAAALLLAGCSGEEAMEAATTPPSPAPATSSTSPAPEDDFIAALEETGLFENVATDARDVWIRTGKSACATLEKNGGDVVDARFAIGEQLVDYSGDGWAEDGLTERVIAVVDAAAIHLCE